MGQPLPGRRAISSVRSVAYPRLSLGVAVGAVLPRPDAPHPAHCPGRERGAALVDVAPSARDRDFATPMERISASAASRRHPPRGRCLAVYFPCAAGGLRLLSGAVYFGQRAVPSDPG